MRKELQFVQLVKVDNVYNFYKFKGDEDGVCKSKVEFFAVYLNTKDNLLEFFPIEKAHLMDGMDIDYYSNSGFLDTIDLSHSHWLPLTDEDKKNEQVKYNLENNQRWKE
jgi:hypothetical protein